MNNCLCVFYTHPMTVSKWGLKPGDYFITISDIEGKESSLYLVKENHSIEPTYYGAPHPYDVKRLGSIPKDFLEKKHGLIFNELIGIRNDMHENKPTKVGLPYEYIEILLNIYTDSNFYSRSQSPCTVRNISKFSPTILSGAEVRFFDTKIENLGPNTSVGHLEKRGCATFLM